MLPSPLPCPRSQPIHEGGYGACRYTLTPALPQVAARVLLHPEQSRFLRARADLRNLALGLRSWRQVPAHASSPPP